MVLAEFPNIRESLIFHLLDPADHDAFLVRRSLVGMVFIGFFRVFQMSAMETLFQRLYTF